MTVEPQTLERVRCRQIVESDLDGLADLLTQGFPETNHGYWQAGFARWHTMPIIDGVPRFGYVLETSTGLVGALLLISSKRGDQIVVNVSSWYVERRWRTHSSLLVAMATKLKHVIYLNASPARHTWRTLDAHNFKRYNHGRSAVFALPGRGRVSHTIPPNLPEARLMADHRAWGLICVTVEKDGILSPFVFRARTLDRPAIGPLRPKVMDILYCRGMDDFARCAPALARHFLPHGVLGFLVDGDGGGAGMWTHYSHGKEPRYFRGPRPPVLGDLAYTEKVIFG
jgi:hypothetical protein